MIKLFGWEKKVIAQVEEKRKVELGYYKKKQWIGQIGGNVKWACSVFRGMINF
jgi:hypothetical protein